MEERSPDEIVTVTEAAEITGLAYSSLAQAVREGRVKARKSGGTWLVTVGALLEALEKESIKPRVEKL